MLSITPQIYFPTKEGCPPGGKENEVAIPVSCDFSLGGGVLNIDFSSLQSSGLISSIQSFYINNLSNTSPVTFVTNTVNQEIDIPFGAQGYMPLLLLPNNPKLTVSCSNPVKVLITFLNFYMPPYLWGIGIGSNA